MDGITIAAVTRAELDVMVGWARGEGWDLGLGDPDVFYNYDPSGFLMARKYGEPAACVSVVRYGEAMGFLGFYICRPDLRGTGLGLATWKAGLARLGDRVIGLDGVVAQQANYRKSGFVWAYNNAGYLGHVKIEDPADPRVVPIGATHLPAIIAYERPLFPGTREPFVAPWIDETSSRIARAYIEDGLVRGYAVLRRGKTSARFGPLFADNETIADTLFRTLAARMANLPIGLDAPLANLAARRLAERHGLTSVFETARMYRGPAPHLDLARIYGITSYELG